MPFNWNDLARPAAAPPDGSPVELSGWIAERASQGDFLLVEEAALCRCCPPDPATTIEVRPVAPIAAGGAPIRLAGRFRRLPPGDASGWRWQLAEARLLGLAAAPGPWLARRALLRAAPLACVAATPACAAAPAQDDPGAAVRALVAASAPTDLHSHAGRVIVSRNRLRPLEPVAAPMRAGGMALVSLAMVADTPVTQVTPDNRIQAMRDPAPGELYAHFQGAGQRLDGLVRDQGLAVVLDRAGLRTAQVPGAPPAIIVASEGADFLEGRIDRVAEAFRTHRLRHLQLVHYRVNELGDIQTSPPVHDGLTDFGAAVVRECNRLGIVVDVAHATYLTVKRVAEVAARPLVLSHTSLSARPGPRSRTITADHARLVAATGGIIGIWPPMTIFPTLRSYAEGMARMVDVVGIDHVGIGSDMLGLLSDAAFADYRQTPALAEALLAVGFNVADAAKLLGGNAMRVFAAGLPG